ncbi:hypothetical protein ACFQ0P_05570 [Microbacterium insulae]|uniref:Lipoprotein n=1 Tax=Microbacterium insulae TaxID=483014 RepID=A0ABW3AHZ0_9MICO
MRQASKLVVIAVSTLLLTGCTSSSIPEFDSPQTDQDRLPDPSSATQADIDPASTRYSGQVEEYAVYLGRSEANGVCVLLVAGDELFSTSCGGAGVGTELASGTKIEAGDFSFDELDGEMLSPSVRVISGS